MSTQISGKKLLAEMSDLMRRLHYSIHTERSYCDWVSRFIRFHQLTSRDALLVDSKGKVEAFLTHLAVQDGVAASTQNQAFNALVFLFQRVLEQPLEGVSAVRSRKEPRIPVVLTRDEVRQMLALLEGSSELVVKLLMAVGCALPKRYVCGCRISIMVIRDVEFIKIPLLLVFFPALPRQVFVA